MTSYDSTFFDYVNSGSLRSARQLLPKMLEAFEIKNVLDVGCGQGAWLSIWQELGVTDVTGVDGDYVERERLLFPAGSFIPHNLSSEFQLDRKYDLVQSLEVAEHLPAASARTFVKSLVRHGNLIMFSAAPKGQGGDGHVNEQNYEYWRALFAEHEYIPIDYLRPLVSGDSQIEPWYRFNTIIYSSPSRFSTMSDKIKFKKIDPNKTIQDISPTYYKARKLIVRCLPTPAMTALAKIKERATLYKLRSE